MSVILGLLQITDIEQKLKEAPDKSYEIGLLIGSLIPFVILVVIAYVFYNYRKRKMDEELN